MKKFFFAQIIFLWLVFIFSCEKPDEISPKNKDEGKSKPSGGVAKDSVTLKPDKQQPIDTDTIVDADSIHVADSIHIADSIHAAELVHVADSLHIADSIHAAELVHIADSIHVTDSIHAAELVHIADSIHVADSIHAAELIHIADSIRVADSLANLPPQQQNSDNYVSGKYNEMSYRILKPRDYDATKKYPILIFLHGIGQRGTDNKRQLTWGASLFQQDSIRENYPAFIIFPQCPADHSWFDRWGKETLTTFIQSMAKKYSIDKHRIYIGGLSMGAYGTYALVADNPDTFAAAIAIAGDGDVRKAPIMSHTNWRIFAGKRDDIVPYDKSEEMANALEKSGANVLYTLYPTADHLGSWVKAFAEPDFCHWLFSKSR